MKRRRRILAILISIITVMAMMPGTGWAATDRSGNHKTVVVACSDFQDYASHYSWGSNGGDYTPGKNTVRTLINRIKSDTGYTGIDGFFCGGDYLYDSNSSDTAKSAKGIAALKEVVDETIGISAQQIYVQGNHDPAGAAGLASFGANDAGDYGVFVINEDYYMSKASDSDASKVDQTASSLRSYLSAKASSGYSKPVFVISHVPLHFSTRTPYEGDARYAEKLLNVLNEYGDQLNIIFLFGHDHAWGDDDYLGGSAVYLAKGDQIDVADNGSKTNHHMKILKFTYLNCGYVGYWYDNWNSRTYSGNADSTLTMTSFEISGNSVTINRWDSAGKHLLKSRGAASIGNRGVAEVCTVTTNTYQSPQTVSMGTPSQPEQQPVTVTENGVTVTALASSISIARNGASQAADNAGITQYSAYEISAQGLSGGATIKMPMASGYDKVWKVTNGGLTEVAGVDISGGYAQFTVSELGTFVAGSSVIPVQPEVTDKYWVQCTEAGDIVSGETYLITYTGIMLGADNIKNPPSYTFTESRTVDGENYYAYDSSMSSDYLWKITKDGENFRITNTAKNRSICVDSTGSLTTAAGNPVTLEKSGDTWKLFNSDKTRGIRWSASNGVFQNSKSISYGANTMNIYRLTGETADEPQQPEEPVTPPEEPQQPALEEGDYWVKCTDRSDLPTATESKPDKTPYIIFYPKDNAGNGYVLAGNGNKSSATAVKLENEEDIYYTMTSPVSLSNQAEWVLCKSTKADYPNSWTAITLATINSSKKCGLQLTNNTSSVASTSWRSDNTFTAKNEKWKITNQYSSWYSLEFSNNKFTEKQGNTYDTYKFEIYRLQHYTPPEPVESQVTFNAGDGQIIADGNPKTMTAKTDENFRLLSLPSAKRTNYHFEGWYTAAGNKVTTSTVFESDATVYARWEEISVPESRDLKIERSISSVSENYYAVTLEADVPEGFTGGVLTEAIGSGVEFIGLTDGAGAAYSSGNITWNITDENSKISYKVRLKNEEAGFRAETGYPVISSSSVSYGLEYEGDLVQKEKSIASDENVSGYLGNVSFVITDNEGNAVKNAKFTLKHDGCSACQTEERSWNKSYSAASSSDGTVSFSGIPSGHSYVLTLSELPEGYAGSASMGIEITEGEVTGAADVTVIAITEAVLGFDADETNTYEPAEYLTEAELDAVIGQAELPLGVSVDENGVITYTGNRSVSFEIPVTASGVQYDKPVRLVTAEGKTSEAEAIAAADGIFKSWNIEETGDPSAVEGVKMYSSAGFLGGSAFAADISSGAPLTFSFTGTGFDIISDVGNTGMLYIVARQNGTVKYAYLADTYFAGGTGINDYGIEVMSDHSMAYGTYDVEVYAVSGDADQTREQIAAEAAAETGASCDRIKYYAQDAGSILAGGNGADNAEKAYVDAVRTYAPKA